MKSPALVLARHIGDRRSALHRRTVELYKARRKFSPHPEGWLDDELWGKCSLRAQEELGG